MEPVTLEPFSHQVGFLLNFNFVAFSVTGFLDGAVDSPSSVLFMSGWWSFVCSPFRRYDSMQAAHSEGEEILRKQIASRVKAIHPSKIYCHISCFPAADSC